MLIPPRIIAYGLHPLNIVESSHWIYGNINVGFFGSIIADFGNDKFNWNPCLELRSFTFCNESGNYKIPIFRYDSSRKNMKPQFKWTKRQILSFFEDSDNRPYDLIGYFDITYEIDKLPVILYNPWERQTWQPK